MPSTNFVSNDWIVPTRLNVAMARRSRSASPGSKPAATIAMPHGLFLEQRNAQRFAQHLSQFILVAKRGDGIDSTDAVAIFAPLQIGMHHLALDRTRAARSRLRSRDRRIPRA